MMELVTIASATAAAGLLASSAGRLAVAGWRRAAVQWEQLRFQNQLQNELSEQTARARMAGHVHWQSTHGNHNPWRVMQVVEVVDESLDVRSFYLQDPLPAAPLAGYRPGQFVIVRPALGGADLPARCYSLSDAPGEDWYRISVKRQPQDSLHRPSLSNWLHDHIRVGDCLLVSGPHGEFFIEEKLVEHAPIVLLSAGVGVTPILSMLKGLLKANPDRPIWVFNQVSDAEHWPFGDLIHSWGQQCTALTATTYFSRLTVEQLPKVPCGSVHAGKVDAATVVQAVSGATSAHYFLCGPNAWMKSFEEGLASLAVPSSNIHHESFTTSAETERTDRVSDEWDLQFVLSGIQIPTSNKPVTILQAASEQGLHLPAACHQGACGTCKLKLLKGTVQYPSRPACSHRADEVVACVARPVGHVELDA